MVVNRGGQGNYIQTLYGVKSIILFNIKYRKYFFVHSSKLNDKKSQQMRENGLLKFLNIEKLGVSKPISFTSIFETHKRTLTHKTSRLIPICIGSGK